MTEPLAGIVEATGGSVPEYFPMLGGHEGAGVVEEVGPGVRSVQPGDHVSTSFIPACGKCRWCVTGMTYLCDNGAMMFAKEMVTDGTRRRHLGGEDLTAMTQLGTSPNTRSRRESVIKIDETIPFEAASLVSCGSQPAGARRPLASDNRRHRRDHRHRWGGINAVQGARAGAEL